MGIKFDIVRCRKLRSLEKKIRSLGERASLNNLSVTLRKEKIKNYKEVLACYLLATEIRIQIQDPNLKQTTKPQ